MGEEGTALRLEDSNIRFFNFDWSPLPSDTYIRVAEHVYTKIENHIYEKPDTSIGDFQQALRSLADFHPMKMSLSPDEATLTVMLQTAQLSKQEREAVRESLHPVTLTWNGQQFIPSTDNH